MTDEKLYTSSQAADLLGISVSTIHTWKRRNLNRLLNGLHWVKDNDTLSWTEQGIQTLSTLKDGGEQNGTELPDNGASIGDGVDVENLQEQDFHESPSLENRYLPLVDMIADAITPRLRRRLDEKVTRNLTTNTAPPMTTIECVAVLSQLGLKPPNPAALLDTKIAGYLAGNDQPEAKAND